MLRHAHLAIAVLLGITCVPAHASTLFFSTTQPAAVPGPGPTGTTSFSDGDVVAFNRSTGLGIVHLFADVINDGGLPDLNALYVRRNGNIIFSTQSGSADYEFDDDMLVEYDPVADTLTPFFDFDGIITSSSDVDIAGFHWTSSGTFLLVNTSDFDLDGQQFQNGDIVEFDPLTGAASLLFDEGLFGGDDVKVRSVSLLANGNIVLSAFNEDTGGEMVLGGLVFGRGALVEYNPINDTASLYFDPTNFGGATEDIDALSIVPIPAAVWLFVSAVGALGLWRRRS